MKVLPFRIPKSKNIGLIYQEYEDHILYDKLHQHEEIQICAIVKGEGSIVVCDTINEYKTGDILVIGSNLPHVFKSETTNFDSTYMISLFFTRESFGKNFFDLSDFEETNNFFKNAITGFKVDESNFDLIKKFTDLKEKTNLNKFIGFLEIMDLLNTVKTSPLSTFIYPKKYTINEGKRMSDIMDYTMNHFFSDISLDTIASISNMTPNAFCRYFKQRTNKTYFQFLIEVRVENACRLLQNKELLVAEISEKSGFKNISNFNRKFKEVKGTTPSKYRNKE